MGSLVHELGVGAVRRSATPGTGPMDRKYEGVAGSRSSQPSKAQAEPRQKYAVE